MMRMLASEHMVMKDHIIGLLIPNLTPYLVMTDHIIRLTIPNLAPDPPGNIRMDS